MYRIPLHEEGPRKPKQVRKMMMRSNPYSEASHSCDQGPEQPNPYSKTALLQHQKDIIEKLLTESPWYRPAQYHKIAARESQPYPEPPSPETIQFLEKEDAEMDNMTKEQLKEALKTERMQGDNLSLKWSNTRMKWKKNSKPKRKTLGKK